jgi:glycopeptide antibiotics resistance protein
MHTSSGPLAPLEPAPIAVAPPPAIPSHPLAALWTGPLITLSFLAIVFLTLFPFNFTVPHGMTLRQAAAPFDWRPYDPSDPMDTVQNIIMFGPLGFALACLARGRNLKSIWLIPFAAFVSCTFSCSIEFLQQWLPTRDSSLADICSNTSGGIVGAAAFLIIGTPLLRVLTTILAKLLGRFTLAAFAVVFLFLLACAVRDPLRMRHVNRNLASWDPAFPLAIGNDPKFEDHPWQGSVTSVDIADAALSPPQVAAAYVSDDLRPILGESLLASYRIHAPGNCIDLTHHSPDLQWIDSDAAQTQATTPPDALPAISGDHWLRSTAPLRLVCTEIRDKSRFTVRCRFRSALVSQSPELGRIVTLSIDPGHCNLTIGQQLTDLVIRLRTPLSGDNGTNPALKIGEFFLSTGPHDLILTYNDPKLRIYVDGPDAEGTANVPADFGNVARYLARSMILPFDGYLPEMYRSVFYLISFAPLGVVLAMLAASRRVDPGRRNIAVAIGLIAPTLVMQFVFVVICQRSFRTDNLLIGVAATVIVAIPAAHWLERLGNAKLVG